MQDINKQVGRQIRAMRQDQKISLEELADRSEVHRSHMGEIERGETNITLATLQRIGVGLHVPLAEILRDVG